MEEARKPKKPNIMLIIGRTMFILGAAVLAFLAFRYVRRELYIQKLLRENPVIEIPAIGVKAPVREGTDNETIAVSAGHFSGTGTFGSGNCCLAGHSSTIYKECFNELKNAEIGMEIVISDTDSRQYTYTVSDMFIVEPSETWILNDFGDDRLTLVTCTDDGTQRQIVVADFVKAS